MPTFPTVYLTVADADALAATILGLTQWSAATSTEKTNALDAATKLIDGALRYQGRKFDPAQSLQFPRAVNGGVVTAGGCPSSACALVGIWDWDELAQAAVVPAVVKQACLIEADEMLQDLKGKSQRWRRLDEQHQGVTFDQAGAAAEAYRKGTPAAGRSGLSRRAYDLLRRFKLSSGRLA